MFSEDKDPQPNVLFAALSRLQCLRYRPGVQWPCTWQRRRPTDDYNLRNLGAANVDLTTSHLSRSYNSTPPELQVRRTR